MNVNKKKICRRIVLIDLYIYIHSDYPAYTISFNLYTIRNTAYTILLDLYTMSTHYTQFC